MKFSNQSKPTSFNHIHTFLHEVLICNVAKDEFGGGAFKTNAKHKLNSHKLKSYNITW